MIKGKRVNLVPLNDECFDLILTWVNDPEIREFTGSRFPVSRIEHEVWFKSRAIDKYNKTFAIQLVDTKKFIGIVGNNEYDPINRTTYPFIYIGNSDYKGKGYGQEALNLIINFCFHELNIHKVFGYLFSYNKASKNMLEKCGYILEGTLKEHWYKNGKYHDVLVMGRVR